MRDIIDTVVLILVPFLLIATAFIMTSKPKPKPRWPAGGSPGLRKAREIDDRLEEADHNPTPPACPLCTPRSQAGNISRRPALCRKHMDMWVQGARSKLQ